MNSMEAKGSSVRWDLLNQEAKAIAGFVESLQPYQIGTGLMRYDEEHFQLLPRSYWTNNNTLQRILCGRDKNATFEGIQVAFAKLIEKINGIQKAIRDYQPASKEECPKKAIELLYKMIRIVQTVNEVAKDGLKQLRENYVNDGKRDNANNLRAYGDEAYKALNATVESLSQRLTKQLPELEANIILQRFSFRAREILDQRLEYEESLKAVFWAEGCGAAIPDRLIEESIRDRKNFSQTSQEALRNAVNHIKLPRTAREIPVLELASWIPLRPSVRTRDGEKTIKIAKNGVTGTCERSIEKEKNNICNLYYLINPYDKQLVISSGAINTHEKAEQLVLCILKASESTNIPHQERFIVHGLNSFYNEENLIKDTCQSITYAQQILRDKMKSNEVSLLYLNTAFNAATTLSSEDPRSSSEINLETLGSIVAFVLYDIGSLFAQSTDEERGLASQLLGNATENTTLAKFYRICPAIVKLAAQVRERKNQLAHSEKFPAVPSPPLTPSAPSINSTEEITLESIEDALNTPTPSPTLLRNSLTRSTNSNEMKKELVEWQKMLEKEFQDLSTCITDLVHELAVITGSPALNLAKDNAILLLHTLNLVLGTQVKLENAPQKLSRCTEIELFFLLYKLLHINPIIICWSGLDRSGAARSLFTSLSLLEKTFYEKSKYSLEHLEESIEENGLQKELDDFIPLFTPTNLPANDDSLSSVKENPRSDSTTALPGEEERDLQRDSLSKLIEEKSYEGAFLSPSLLEGEKEKIEDPPLEPQIAPPGQEMEEWIEKRARTDASMQLFNLILNQDRRRNELFSLCNRITYQKELTSTYVTKFENNFESQEGMKGLLLRNKILTEIDATYPQRRGQEETAAIYGSYTDDTAEEMKNALYYLELFATNLLSVESIKTLYSCGAVGFKYHHDADFFRRQWANPHPLDRLPMFIFPVNRDLPSIKVVHYSVGMFSTSIQITEAAITILLRLNRIRGS